MNLIICQRADGTEYRFPEGQPMTGDVTNQFCKWLITEQNKGVTLISHNFRGYDGHFILKYMLDNNLKPEVIKHCTKLLDLQYKRLKINARDTLNFCALKLTNFQKAVGLNHLVSKGEFPHLANRPENWDKIIDFPKPSDYMIESRTKRGERKISKVV